MTVASTSAEPKATATATATATAAGIVERADTQQRVIPESRRADGSIRKERKVRPGFTPVEDVARYRPARAREAEEARKNGVPGSAAAVAAVSSSSPSSSASALPATSKLGGGDTNRTAWRSSTARAPPSWATCDATNRPRGNFAPLEPASARRTKNETSSKTGSAENTQAPLSAAPPWRNSRLRKLQPPKEKQQETATVPDTWDQQEPSTGKATDKKQNAERTHTSASLADDLAAELDSLLCINSTSSKASRDD